MNIEVEDFGKIKDYRKAISELISSLEKEDIVNVQNWIQYADVLKYEFGNKGAYKKMSLPILNILKEKYPMFIDDIEFLIRTNQIKIKVDMYIENVLKGYYNYDFFNVTWNILLDYEAMLSNHSPINTVEQLLQYSKAENRISNLSFILKILMSRRSNFKKASHLSGKKDEVIRRIKRVNKKIEKTIKLDNVVEKFIILENIMSLNQTSKIELLQKSKNNDTINLLITPGNQEIRKQLSRMRMNSFDIKYTNIKNNLTSQMDFPKKNISYPDGLRIEDEYSFAIMYDFFNKDVADFTSEVIDKKLDNFEFMYDNNYLDRDSLDKEVKLGKQNMGVTYFDLISFYNFVLLASYIQYDSEKKFVKKNNSSSFSSVLRVSYDQFRHFAYGYYYHYIDKKYDVKKLDKMIEFFTFGFGDIHDLSYQPLIQIEEFVFLMPNIILSSNIQRTFLSYISMMNGNLKAVSWMERYVYSMFEEHGFKVYNDGKKQLNFRLGNKQGDIDLLAIKDNKVFYAQLKNRHQPIENSEFLNFDRNLKRVALKQLKHAKEYLLSNPKDVLNALNIESFDDFEFIPMIITNAFYRSGDYVEGIYIIDMSSLHKLFDDGFIKKTVGSETIEIILREGKNVTANDLIELLKKPYFFNQNIYNTSNLEKTFEIELEI